MTKANMIETLKNEIRELDKRVLAWGEMLNMQLDEMGMTFKEALEQGDIYKTIEYQTRFRLSEALSTLERLAETMGIELD